MTIDQSVGPSPPLNLLQGAALFLDFDGTIVPIAARPEAVQVTEALRHSMYRLFRKLDGRLAIVSGRSIRQIERLFKYKGGLWRAFERRPFVIAGSHGLETLWPNGRLIRAPRPKLLRLAVSMARDLEGKVPGVFVEKKPFGVALHYRLAPDAEEICRVRAEQAARLSDLVIQPGKMVFELKAPGADKGAAIAMIMKDRMMACRSPIFLGDDATDEPGFAAVSEMSGAGIFVGPWRNTNAKFHLPDVEAVLAWLNSAGDLI